MKKCEKIESIGRRMPYKVPDGYSAKLNELIWEQTAATIGLTDTAATNTTGQSGTCSRKEKAASKSLYIEAEGRKSPKHINTRHIWGTAIAAAAVVVVTVGISLWLSQPVEMSFEQMLTQLTDEQCNSLVGSYEGDHFLYNYD